MIMKIRKVKIMKLLLKIMIFSKKSKIIKKKWLIINYLKITKKMMKKSINKHIQHKIMKIYQLIKIKKVWEIVKIKMFHKIKIIQN